MAQRPVLTPTSAHPITITETGHHVTVRIGGVPVAETDDALTLQESTYPPVHYLPLADVRADVLTRSDTTTYCPYKGDAAYYHVGDVQDAVWTYEEPFPAVAAIAGRVAFYPDKADIDVGP